MTTLNLMKLQKRTNHQEQQKIGIPINIQVLLLIITTLQSKNLRPFHSTLKISSHLRH